MVMVARSSSAAHTLLSSPLLDEGIPLEVAQTARRALGVLTALASPLRDEEEEEKRRHALFFDVYKRVRSVQHLRK